MDIAGHRKAVSLINLEPLHIRNTRVKNPTHIHKDNTVEGSGWPEDSKIEIQKFGKEPQGQLARKAQIKIDDNFGASYENIIDIEPSNISLERLSKSDTAEKLAKENLKGVGLGIL